MERLYNQAVPRLTSPSTISLDLTKLARRIPAEAYLPGKWIRLSDGSFSDPPHFSGRLVWPIRLAHGCSKGQVKWCWPSPKLVKLTVDQRRSIDMVLLSVTRVSKTFGDQTVLHDVTFDIRSQDHVALVGPNGTGKTTLLRILTGQIPADGGDVALPSAGTVGYLQQHPEFADSDTVWSVASGAVGDIATLARQAEMVAEQLSTCVDEEQHARLIEQLDRLQVKLHQEDAYNWEHRVERVLQGLGFVEDWYQRPAKQLSGGQQNRLMLVCLLLQQPDLMILDEPNNHLDIESTEWLENTLANWTGAYLLVSHDRYFLDQTATSVLELVDSRIDRFKGNYSAYVRQKSERLEVQRRTYEKQKEEIEKLQEFIRKHHHGQKSTQAEDRRKKLERIELVDPPREIPTPKFHFPPASRTGDVVLRCEKLSKAFDRPLFANLSFQIERGQRWAILGSNGSGKSTLLRCLLGEMAPDAGNVHLGHNLQIGYFDQLLKRLPENVSAAEAIRVPHRDLIDRERRDILAAFGLTGDVTQKPLSMLSGGERNRTMLAWLSAMQANFLVLDEPTNHLDLWSRQALEAALNQFDGTVLLVTHDRYLVNSVADHVLVMGEGKVSQIDGNYEAYRHWLREGLAIADRGQIGALGSASRSGTGYTRSEVTGTTGQNPGLALRSSDGGKRKRKYPYRKVVELETEIAEAECSLDQLHKGMLDPNNLRDGRKMKDLQQQVVEQEQKLLQLYEHYEEACELN
ncbi:MAG: ABC-F family ATP-binding cassette domain-containing protein [Planctomycetales bacterium]|nr:ABC-F family ATP-binding cassette domain-containing protein [Planctomycetales bacterium]